MALFSLSSPLGKLVIALVILVPGLVVYQPVMGQRFIGWDDGKFLAATWKPSWERVSKIVTDFDLSYTREVYYSPLPFLSIMLDQVIVGSATQPQAWIAKLTNVCLHLVNCLLIYALLLCLNFSVPAAAVGAILFAVHPLQVGTVAWITERKNLLCALFYLIAVLIWVRSRMSGLPSPALRTLPLFVAAVLSKPLGVTLPVALAAGDFLLPTPQTRPRFSLRAGLVLGAMLMAGVLWGIFVLSTERTQPGILPIWHYRPLIAAGALWFYLGKFIAPVGLVPLYPRWEISDQLILFSALLAALIAMIALVVAYRRHMDQRAVWGAAVFVITLAPVSGLIPFGYMTHSYVADHFLYLPMVGLAVITASLFQFLYHKAAAAPRLKVALALVTTVWLSLLAVQAGIQTAVWQDAASVWEATLRINKTSFAAYNNYGLTLMNRGDYQGALQALGKAAELAPRLSKPLYNMGQVYARRGQLKKAREFFTKAYRMNPRSTMNAVRLGQMIRAQGSMEEAVAFLTDAANHVQQPGPLFTEIGITLVRMGRAEEAIPVFRKAMRTDPSEPAAYYHLASLMLSQGSISQSIDLLQKSLQRKPTATAYHILGSAYAGQGEMNLALISFLRAFRMDPALTGLSNDIANAFMDMGNFAAARHFCSHLPASAERCSKFTRKRLNQEDGR
jgi:tetratricopeptide (TPR) repeat protein